MRYTKSSSSHSTKDQSVSSPEILHVSRALREHGIVHLGDLAPADEYDCCAETAINAYKEYQRVTKRARPNEVVSTLLN
jgi:hypothetical protein